MRCRFLHRLIVDTEIIILKIIHQSINCSRVMVWLCHCIRFNQAVDAPITYTPTDRTISANRSSHILPENNEWMKLLRHLDLSNNGHRLCLLLLRENVYECEHNSMSLLKLSVVCGCNQHWEFRLTSYLGVHHDTKSYITGLSRRTKELWVALMEPAENVIIQYAVFIKSPINLSLRWQSISYCVSTWSTMVFVCSTLLHHTLFTTRSLNDYQKRWCRSWEGSLRSVECI